MEANSMKINYIWNVSLNHHKVGEMFIVCGVLYAVDSVSDRNTKIRFAFDLYNEKLLDVNLAFSNPFKKTTTIGYNHRHKVTNLKLNYLISFTYYFTGIILLGQRQPTDISNSIS